MNAKNFLRVMAACLLIAVLCAMTACGGSKLRKVTGVYGAGSSFYVMSHSGAPYRVDGIPASCNGNFITLEGYVRNRNGEPHDVLDSGGQRISSIRLVPEAEAFGGETFDIDVASYGADLLIVEKNVGKVRLWSSVNDSVQISVIVEERDTPLMIALDHIYINTRRRVPFLISPNEADIVLSVTGDCSIMAGNVNMTDDEFQQYRQIVEEIKTLKKTWTQIKHPGMSAIVLCYSFLCCSSERLSEGGSSGANSFVDEFIKFNDMVCDDLQTTIDALHGLYYGDDGADGLDGAPAILTVGGLEIKGDGYLAIFGGNGADGFDGSFALGFGGDGGDGGDSGYAAFSQVVIDAAGVAEFARGIPGKGGKGGGGLGAGDSGSAGKLLDEVKAQHFFIVK